MAALPSKSSMVDRGVTRGGEAAALLFEGSSTAVIMSLLLALRRGDGAAIETARSSTSNLDVAAAELLSLPAASLMMM